MPDFVTRDGQIIRNAPDHVITALKTLEDHAALSAPPAPRGPTAADRLTEMRERQFAAGQQNKPLPTPVAPQLPTPAVNVATMTQAERWALMRATDQSTMKPYQRPS